MLSDESLATFADRKDVLLAMVLAFVHGDDPMIETLGPAAFLPTGAHYGERDLPDGRLLHVVPLSYGRARLHIGQQGVTWYDDAW